MGAICNGQEARKNIIVATLNFSGICLSPFEYHDGSVDKDVLSELFGRLMRKNGCDQKFSWSVGKIDLKMQVERYTPVYRKDAGVVQGRFLNRQEFEGRWDKQFNQNKEKAMGNIPVTLEQIAHARLFDWIAYETFMTVVYVQNHKKQTFDWDKLHDHDPSAYLQFLQKWHSEPYLDNTKKMKIVANFLRSDSVDVVFLQEAEVRGKVKWQDVLPQEYGVLQREGTESAIIYWKKRFSPGPDSRGFFEEYKDIINWNNDTAFFKTGNLLLASVHLSSKAEKYVAQGQKMLEDLRMIRLKNPGLEIILGCDTNHFIIPPKDLHFVPNDQKDCTTAKKRTMIQLQTAKANLIVVETKDQIISTQKAIKTFIGMLNGSKMSEKHYLPTPVHPFDHFLVCGEIVVEDTSPKM